MSSFLILAGGPTVAFLAAIFSFLPNFRPKKFAKTLLFIALACWLPLLASYLVGSGFFILILRPGTIFLCLLAGIGALVHVKKHKLPAGQITAPILLLIAAIWDTFSLIFLFGMAGV